MISWKKTTSELEEHIFSTYVSLRYGLAAIGIGLPIVICLAGKLNGVGLKGSMSAYYWVTSASGYPSPRDCFVGGLFAVAACLYLYKGFTTLENVFLNLAAVFGAGVAMIPECQAGCGWFTLHGLCGVSTFVCLAVVVLACARDTLSLLPEESAGRYRKLYGMIGLVMLASPATAWVMNALTRGEAFTFWIESAGIGAFAAYWLVKSTELKKSRATIMALRGELETSPQGKAVPAPLPSATWRAASARG
jgi:hypothetical protein